MSHWGRCIFSQEKVAEKIRALKPRSAPGPYKIGTGLLKYLEDMMSLPLGIIYNKSVTSGKVPMDWREPNVTPIFKKGSGVHSRIQVEFNCAASAGPGHTNHSRVFWHHLSVWCGAPITVLSWQTPIHYWPKGCLCTQLNISSDHPYHAAGWRQETIGQSA